MANMTSLGQNAQTTFDGKIYEAEIQIADKIMKNNGHCLIYTYCILTFEKDSVSVSYRREARCSPSHLEANYKNLNETATEKKKYLYTATNKTVRIENFQRYDFLPEQMLILTIENNGERLIAKEEKNMETLNGVFHFKGFVQNDK